MLRRGGRPLHAAALRASAPLVRRARLHGAPMLGLSRVRQPPRRSFAAAGLGGAAPGDAPAELRRIHAALADAFSGEEAVITGGKVELNLGPAIGYYTLSSETSGNPPVAKILLASPVSGAHWYVWDAANASWCCPDNGHHLVELFVREVMHSTARYVNL